MPTLPATITVPNTEYTGGPEVSPSEHYSSEGFKGTRHLMVAWADRNLLMQQLMGSTIGIETDGPRTLHELPHLYPYNDTGAFVQAVGCRPFGKPVTDASKTSTEARTSYEWAIVSAEYANYGGNVIDSEQQDLIEENIEAAGQHLTLSEQQLYWDSGQTDPLNPMEAPQFFQSLFDWVYSRKRVRVIPGAFTSLFGKVNAAGITSVSLGVSFAAETLLYSSFNIRRLITTAGVQAWDLNIRFTYNSSGWNTYRKRGTQAPAIIYNSGGTQFKPYATGDFLELVVQ